MSEAKYTPGEWTLHLSEHDLPVIEVAPHRTIVVEARSYDEAVANANLFFHSRELLEALEEAETLVSTLTDPKAKVPHRADVARELLPRIQKVINRARGKQP